MTLSYAVACCRDACGIHDICYYTPGRSQASCDDEFLVNMMSTCIVSRYAMPDCLALTYTAYAAVRIGGRYFDPQNCHEI